MQQGLRTIACMVVMLVWQKQGPRKRTSLKCTSNGSTNNRDDRNAVGYREIPTAPEKHDCGPQGPRQPCIASNMIYLQSKRLSALSNIWETLQICLRLPWLPNGLVENNSECTQDGNVCGAPQRPVMVSQIAPGMADSRHRSTSTGLTCQIPSTQSRIGLGSWPELTQLSLR